MFADLRSQIDPILSATDATPMQGGSTHVMASQKLAETLYRNTYSRGGHRRLDGAEPLHAQTLDQIPADAHS